MQMENVQGRCLQVTVILTSRESEISGYVCEGLSDSEIAQMMGLSVNTLRAHLRNIRMKTNLVGQSRVVMADSLRTINVPKGEAKEPSLD